MKAILLILLPVITWSITEYNRADYQKRWIDSDRNGWNTREEVLIEENIGELVVSNNKIISGLWYDPYVDMIFTDPKVLDIDHFIPLKEAHISGAWAWSQSEKRRFGNNLEDPRHLIAVSRHANRQKGSKDPCQWMPPNIKYWGEYLDTWISLKEQWDLEIDPKEKLCIGFNKILWRIYSFFYSLFFN